MKHESDNFNMLLFMAHLSLMFTKMEDLKGLNVYDKNIASKANELVDAMDNYNKAINREAIRSGHTWEQRKAANLQYATVRDSLEAWCNVWEQMIQRTESEQEQIDAKIREVLKQHQIKVLYENTPNNED